MSAVCALSADFRSRLLVYRGISLKAICEIEPESLVVLASSGLASSGLIENSCLVMLQMDRAWHIRQADVY